MSAATVLATVSRATRSLGSAAHRAKQQSRPPVLPCIEAGACVVRTTCGNESRMTAVRTVGGILLIALGVFLTASVSAIAGSAVIVIGVFLLPWYSWGSGQGGPVKLPGMHQD